MKLELPAKIEGKQVVLFSATSKWSQKDSESDYYNSGFQLDEISDMEQLMQKFCFSDSSPPVWCPEPTGLFAGQS